MDKQNIYHPKNKSLFQKWIGYGWILKHLPFFLFLTLLAIMYIYNGHWADKTIRDINVTAKEVKEMEYEYKTLKSEEMFKVRETQMIQAAAPLGLKLSDAPPVRINTGSTENIYHEKPQ